jgi:hypothetical protein
MKIVSLQMVEVCSELDIVSGEATGRNTDRSLCPANLRDFNFWSIGLFLICTTAFAQNTFRLPRHTLVI